ncbi:hypothetical protein [Saccharopolyspora sp. NPDC002686]|uniref:hypothetical protein n=1 Tax=Saccharopolyspora sp. NPDC002686 TaxID=3154541 RepID=UPI0033262B8F
MSVSADAVGEALSSVGEALSSWTDAVRRAEHGETVPVVAHGEHVADVVPSGEIDRLRETIEVLSDSDLIRDLREGLADLTAGRTVTADQMAADLQARQDNE